MHQKMEDGMNKNVAEEEYTQYVYFMDQHVGSLLEELFPKDLIDCILEYAALDDCEHFEAVIRLNPEMFKFAWVYNEIYARRNWAHDLRPYELFVTPEYITSVSILTFNEGPGRMQRFACSFPPLDESPIFPEDDIVAAFKQSAVSITKILRDGCSDCNPCHSCNSANTTRHRRSRKHLIKSRQLVEDA